MSDPQSTSPRNPTAVTLLTAPTLNIANILTFFRLLLVPVFGVLLLHTPQTDTYAYAASAVFGLAAATDFIDGYIARRYNLITNFGKIADPIADKALIGTGLVLLSAQGVVPVWVTALILFREVAVTIIRLRVLKHGVIPASRGGKAKTISQLIAVLIFVLPLPHAWTQVANVCLGVAVILTLGTGIDYVARALKLVRERSDGAK
jgi:CDP-diacylglycerol---glycerol-3-phosphate 3-phosphatidyltransferase